MKTAMKMYVFGAAILTVSVGVMTERAFADGTFSLTGTVPAVTTADVIWQNPHLGLSAYTGAAGNLYTPIGELQVYSNDANGFTISMTDTNSGLLGASTAVTIAYDVALFSSMANAQAGTTFLAAPGTAGTASAYAAASTTSANLLVSGTLTAPVDTGSGANAYWIGTKIATAALQALMADTYSDVLTVTIVGN